MRRVAFPFWLFSGRTYGKRGVERACLALQDECGADVNLLLYFCWIGSLGKRLDRRAVRSAMAAVGRWQHGSWPLRRAGARSEGAGGAAGAGRARAGTLHAGLDAEYVEQRVLAKGDRCAAIGGQRSPRGGGINLDRYLHSSRGDRPRQARCQTLIAAA
jgi:uncharacterized protein (TIGR02444 family)